MSTLSYNVTEEVCYILEPYLKEDIDLALLDMLTWEREDLKRLKSLIEVILTEK